MKNFKTHILLPCIIQSFQRFIKLFLFPTILQYFYNFQANNNLIANNLGYYGMFGFYAYSYNSGSYKFECRQNTIYVDATKSPYAYHYTYGLYLYPYYHTDIDVTGNIVNVENSYGAYPVYTYSTSLGNYKRWDYNTYYTKNISYQYKTYRLLSQ